MNIKRVYDLKNIALECNVKEGSILSYIKYCVESGISIPEPIAYAKSKFPEFGTKYLYEKDDAIKIIELFKNKKRGEMADYNYRKNWGAKHRDKYPKA